MGGEARPAAYRGTKLRTAQVDSVRALAALSILAFHVIAFSGGLPGWAYRLGFPLESGVTVFLVISGFLLFRPFVRAHLTDEAPPAVVPYFVRRFMRIFPAFWVALTVSALVLSWGYVFDFNGVLKYFSLSQVYFSLPPNETAISPAWTLGLELSFYVFLPVWALLIRRLHRGSGRAALVYHWRALAALAGFGLLYKFLLVGVGGGFGGVSPVGYAALATLPAYIDDFALGMALALIVVGDQTKIAARPRIATEISKRPWIAWGAALCAYALAMYVVRPNGHTGLFSHQEYAWRVVLYAVIGLGLVAPAALGMGRGSVINWFLNTRVLVSAGLISYGIYLWHWSVIAWVPLHFPDVGINFNIVRAVVTLVFTVVLATLSYLLIERPGMLLARRAGGSYRGEVDPPPAVPLGEEGLAKAGSS
jgi:peptidoglycan/LPS O-acetylase OafA/YrhL